MILCKLSLCDSSTSLFMCVFIHIGYRGIIILNELSQCDSSNFLCVWLCILNGYRGFTILCELSYMILQFRFMCDFVFTLVICIMILCELSLCDFSTLLCVFAFTLITGESCYFAKCLNVILRIHFVCGFLIGYRGIVILHELSLNDSSILLCVI